ncbi:MAG TPA: TetR/AcrR family transcriptional regulator [Streptosporangiaceae bacterium]|nr:TetR/AcrR family transcriptional regulator [Streptosporangiaceae bacterium]
MRADARRNYEKLLAAAAAAFAERGADDVSLEEIARRAGVGIGTLYRHFPTRQALLESVYRDQVELLARRADDLMAADSPADALADWLGAMVAWGATKRSLSTTLLATLGKESELISTCSLMLRHSIEKLLRRAQETGAARDDIQPADVLRLVHGLVVACGQTPADPAQVSRMLALVIDGLRPQPAGAGHDGGLPG